MTVARRALAAFALLLCMTPVAAAAQAPAPLRVFAAASLKNALDEVNAAYVRTGAAAPTVSYAASSTLARQIEQGAQADLYLSADSDWMNYVAERRLIRPGTRRDLLTNRLALIAPRASTARLTVRRGFPLAAALGRGRLAMAGLDVPAGRYGKAALTSLGVWDSVAAKTAYGENVRAALAFVARGEAPFGIVYDTDAMVEPGVRIVALFPEGSHPKIVYPAAVTAASRNPTAAGYARFLAGPRASAVFRKYGFKTTMGAR
jgi:molybdate transport system substrate-binding protein